MIQFHASLADDPEKVAEWYTKFLDALSGEARSTLLDGAEVSPSGSPPDGSDPENKIAVFKEASPLFADRLSRLHEGLIALGYEAQLPKPRVPGSAATYVAYVDPANQLRFGETNSTTFYFVRKAVQAEVDGHEYVNSGSQTSSVRFDSEDKVDFILMVAEQQKK
jgi:hypothetical protein